MLLHFTVAPQPPGMINPWKNEHWEKDGWAAGRDQYPVADFSFHFQHRKVAMLHMEKDLLQKPPAYCKLKIDRQQKISGCRTQTSTSSIDLHKSDEHLDVRWLLRSWSRLHWLQCRRCRARSDILSRLCRRCEHRRGGAVRHPWRMNRRTLGFRVHLFDRGRGGVVGPIGHRLREDLRCEQGCGPCKPSIHPGTITVIVDSMASFSLVGMSNLERSLVELKPHLPVHGDQSAIAMWTAWNVRHLSLTRKPGARCQSWRPWWSWCWCGMLHFCESCTGDDLCLPLQQLRPGLKVKIALIQVLRKDDQAAHLVLVLCHGACPPALMDGRQLSELLRLFRTFHSGPVLSDRCDGPDQSWPWNVWHREPRARDRSSRALQVDAIVGIPVAELEAICIVAHCITGRSVAHSEFKPRASWIAGNDRTSRTNWVRSPSTFKAKDGDPPSNGDGDHHGEPGLALIGFSDKELVHELLLHSQVSVGAIAPENPMEQNFIAVVDLDIGVRCRRVAQHGPWKRLERRVWKCTSCALVPPSTRVASVALDRDGDHHLDAIPGVVAEESHMEARVGWHDLITLGHDVDRAGRIAHDLGDQPRLERRHNAIVPLVHHDDGLIFSMGWVCDGLQEPRHLNFIRVVCIRPCPIATRTSGWSPATTSLSTSAALIVASLRVAGHGTNRWMRSRS